MNEYMDVAIDLSDDNFEKNYGGPFGACIVKDGKIIGKGINRVIKDNDPTAHAEIVAIRNACKHIKSHDLSRCELYTSCYPCPMCLSAIIWANIKTIYYANNKEDAAEIGFRDELIYNYLEKLTNGVKDEQILKLTSMKREEAIKVFEEYKKDINKIKY